MLWIQCQKQAKIDKEKESQNYLLPVSGNRFQSYFTFLLIGCFSPLFFSLFPRPFFGPSLLNTTPLLARPDR